MASGEATNAAQAELIRRNLGFIAFDDMLAALDAAAAVDGDAQWNAAIDAAMDKIADRGGANRHIYIEAIRSLKRLK